MVVDITQTARIRSVYRGGLESLKVEEVWRFSSSGSEYTTLHFSCDVHNLGTHIDVMSADVILENER